MRSQGKRKMLTLHITTDKRLTSFAQIAFGELLLSAERYMKQRAILIKIRTSVRGYNNKIISN